jgi:hypothetical protein
LQKAPYLYSQPKIKVTMYYRPWVVASFVY